MYCLNPFIPSRFLPELLKCLGAFLLLFGFCTKLSGQIQKGQVYVGGSFEFTKSGSSPTIKVNPELGIMLSSRWSVGCGLPFAYNLGYENGLNNVFFAPFIRHYSTIGSKFHLITQFEAEMRLSGYGTKEMSDKYLLLRATPLLNYMIGSRFALEADFGSLTYARSKNYDFKGSFYAHSYRAEFRLFPSFTLRYYFPKREQTN
ncbi:hypothetical protein [Haliscomenobacter sp.]|uniref:hypothetical protein n=1 Tax=Haliscomenobacter sp. TaxID=2717303 RepID=UPI003364BE47